MSSNILPKEKIRAFKRAELVDSIDHGVSLLRSLGADDMLNEMKGSGFLCRLLAFFICLGKPDRSKMRKRTVRIFRLIAPWILKNDLPSFDGCVVIGFNHPSLGEIFRLLAMGFLAYPDKDFLFPVNIPWYETMVPIIPELNSMGIFITPMITPRTENTLLDKFGDDDQMKTDISHYKISMEKVYLKRAKDMSSDNAVIVLAPSATRQKGVFPNEEARQGSGHIHPVMTLLAHRICTDENSRILFVPVRVFLPDGGSMMFNLFRKYMIVICESFSSAEIFGLVDGHSREFDYMFLKRMDDVVA